MTTFGKKKRGTGFALSKRKSSKKEQRREMDERFKRLKAEMEEIIEHISRRSWLLKVGEKVKRLEEEVAAKKAEIRLLRQQLMKEETKVEATLQKLSNLRTVNALLFVNNIRDQDLVNSLARHLLG